MAGKSRVFAFVFSLVFACTSLGGHFVMPLAMAQSATTSLRGAISDSKGFVVPGANVILSNAATGFSRTTKTDSQGVYQFLEVPPANYLLTVQAPGFAKLERDHVLLQVSSPATLEPELAGGRQCSDGRGDRRSPDGQHYRCNAGE